MVSPPSFFPPFFVLIHATSSSLSILFSWNESFFLARGTFSASFALGKSLEMLCHSLNFGIHAVALFVFAYYRSVQDLPVFVDRKMFHGFIQLAFALMSLFQFCLGVWTFHPLALQDPDNISVVPGPLWYYLVRFSAHLLNAVCYFRTKITYVGLSDPVFATLETDDQNEQRAETRRKPEEGEEEEEEEENGPSARPLLVAKAGKEGRDITRMASPPAAAPAGGADNSTRLAVFMKSVLLWERDSKITVYLFFVGIVVASAAVLAHETFVVDTAMVVGANFHPSELGTLSVTYTIFYHFLFIVTGYGLRAVMDRNVLFLDVYRMALASVSIVLLGYNILVLRNLPLLDSTSGLVWAYNYAQVWIPVILMLVAILSFAITTMYNRRIERLGFSSEATHM